jgi:hypothetical protein
MNNRSYTTHRYNLRIGIPVVPVATVGAAPKWGDGWSNSLNTGELCRRAVGVSPLIEAPTGQSNVSEIRFSWAVYSACSPL